MEKRELLYSGKAKTVYKTDTDNEYIIEYRNDLTALNGEKKGSFSGKGALNNKISTIIFEHLNKNGITTHFIRKIDENTSLVKKVEIIPLEVIMRNYSAGSFAKKYGMKDGIKLNHTVYELCYKNDDLGDPMLNEYHAKALDLATDDELLTIKNFAFNINELLVDFFKKVGLILVDFKIEFGKDENGDIILADEISPDTCRFWDIDTLEKLDKDRFRQDLGGYDEAYKQILRRLENGQA